MAKESVSRLAILFLVLLAACGGPAPTATPPPASSGGNQPNVVSTAQPTPTLSVPSDILIMPGATDLNVNAAAISYVVKSDLQGVIDFYEKGMPAKGWTQTEKPSILGTFGRANYANPGHQVSLLLSYSEPLNQVVVRMNIVTLNVFQATPTP